MFCDLFRIGSGICKMAKEPDVKQILNEDWLLPEDVT